MTRDESVRRARVEGYEYGKRGQDPRLCPYDKLSEEWNVWQRWHTFGTFIRSGDVPDKSWWRRLIGI
jgi:ribosome modulation factor